MNLENVKKIYFVGIGGIAMSAAAGIAKNFDYEVCGSDSKEIYSPAKDILDELDIDYFIGYSKDNIANSGADLVVVSAGESLVNPEIEWLNEQNMPYFSFAELLGALAEEKIRIVVTGTNGKSTTSGLLGHSLKGFDDSSFMTGAVLQRYNTNFHVGTGHYFVFEGDEYKATFDDPTPKLHFYKPDILVITNLEFDHPDIFESVEQIENEFALAIENLPQDGLLIYNADDARLPGLAHKTNVSSFSFGIDNDADFKGMNLSFGPEGTKFSVLKKKTGEQYEFSTPLPGKINVWNALASIATLWSLGFAHEQMEQALASYYGVKRRFEFLGLSNGVSVYDDYAHHPTAIKETLAAAKSRFPNSKIWAVFEPHTFSRTQATLPELSTAFANADQALIAEIYPAREKQTTGTITAQQVVSAIRPNNPNVRLVKDKFEALQILKSETNNGDIVVVMAVGNFNTLGNELLSNLN